MIVRTAALFLLAIWPLGGHAQDSLSAAVAEQVRNLCRGSSTEGVQRERDGSTSVPLGDSDERLSFSEREWQGIQQVLPEHQAQDSADYRNCVVSITPAFLEAEREERRRRSEGSPSGSNSRAAAGDEYYCEFQNDGECDEPDVCPVGTDTADCRARNEAFGSEAGLCDFQNDGVCDEPYVCPVGTDTADCSAQTYPNQFGTLQSQQQPQLFCCDMFGFKRCPMVLGATFPGDACFCPGQGTGLQCF